MTDKLHIMYLGTYGTNEFATVTYERAEKKPDEPSKLYTLARQAGNEGFWNGPVEFIPAHRVVRILVEFAEKGQ